MTEMAGQLNMSEYDTFDKAMDTILKADPTRVRAQMEADRKANTEARENRRHEAAMDKVGAKLAKEMGPVRLIQPENDPVRGAFNQAMKKQRLRKVN